MDASSADEGTCWHELTTRLRAHVPVFKMHSCLYMCTVMHCVCVHHFVLFSHCPSCNLCQVCAEATEFHQCSLATAQRPAVLIYERGAKSLVVAALKLHVLAFCNWI